MSANNDIGLAVATALSDFHILRIAAQATNGFYGHWPLRETVAEGVEVLLCQQCGRH